MGPTLTEQDGQIEDRQPSSLIILTQPFRSGKLPAENRQADNQALPSEQDLTSSSIHKLSKQRDGGSQIQKPNLLPAVARLLNLRVRQPFH